MAEFLNTPEEEMSEEEIQQLMALGIIPEELEHIKGQMAEANALRNKMPEMRGNDRVQTAAHPLEFAVQAFQGIKSGKELERLRAEQSGLLQKQVKGRGDYYNAWKRAQKAKNQAGFGTLDPDPMDEIEGQRTY
jgi:hypothetical protein